MLPTNPMLCCGAGTDFNIMSADNNFLEGGGDWLRYQEFVVQELKRHGASLESLTMQVQKLSRAVAATSTKGMIFGICVKQ